MIEFFSSLPREAAVFLISMLPIGELRVAIPVAINKYGMGVLETYLIAVLGNVFPVIFIILFIDKLSVSLSSHFPALDRFFKWLFERTRKKHSKKFELYEELFLVTFVAIPLPMTGGWSGALAAFVFGIPPKKSIPLITAGIMIAGVIVTIVTKGVGFVI